MSRIGSDEPRRHHYLFAHRILPALAAADPRDFAALAESGRLADALVEVWGSVGKKLGRRERLAPDGLGVQCHDHSGRRVVLVTMPPAVHMTEAHFVAVVLHDGVERYLVLEHSWTLDDRPSTTIGEWRPEGLHFNRGQGPAPRADTFMTVVRQRIDDPEPVPTSEESAPAANGSASEPQIDLSADVDHDSW